MRGQSIPAGNRRGRPDVTALTKSSSTQVCQSWVKAIGIRAAAGGGRSAMCLGPAIAPIDVQHTLGQAQAPRSRNGA
jgi:hypothetical protein